MSFPLSYTLPQIPLAKLCSGMSTNWSMERAVSSFENSIIASKSFSFEFSLILKPEAEL